MKIDDASLKEIFNHADEDEVPRVIRGIDIKKVYHMGKTEVHALKGATLDIEKGEYLSIMGPSGSGKTTLFNMIGALQKPTSGKVYIDQVDIAQLDHNELAWLRCRKIGYIFQTFNLIPVMTCLENVTLPMSFAGTKGELAREKGIQILKMVGLEHRILHKPSELSGGQQQRVAIARSLANDPEIILADEPTGNLDQETGQEMIELLSELKENLKVTIVSATHDHKMLRRSNRILWIEDGRIVKSAHPDEIDFTDKQFH